jgi:hypothetical protein
MKAKDKAARFYHTKVQPKTQQVKKGGAKWLLRNSVIFTKVYEHQESRKGIFFTMKAKLTKFYVNKVEPKLEAIKVKLDRSRQRLAGLKAAIKTRAILARQQVTGWVARRQRSLWIAAIIFSVLVAAAAVAYLWQRSPVFRTAVKSLGVVTASVLITLWALLKGLGLSLNEGLKALEGSLKWLVTTMLHFLAAAWTRFTGPMVRIVVTPLEQEERVPTDGRLA